MAEANNSFVRAFLPGLVIGLIVGGIAGAVLPELLAASPVTVSGAPGNGVGERDRREAESPDLPVPEEIPESEQLIDDDGGINERPIDDAGGTDDDDGAADADDGGAAG